MEIQGFSRATVCLRRHKTRTVRLVALMSTQVDNQKEKTRTSNPGPFGSGPFSSSLFSFADTSGIITAMEFPWSKSQHRRELLASPFPAGWQRILVANVPAYSRLPEAQQQALRDTTWILVAEKNWEGASGLTLTDEIKVTVAGHAARLVLGFEREYFPNVETIIVYPQGFLVTTRRVETRGVFAEQVLAASGQAAQQGPVIVSWADVRDNLAAQDGQNVVLHEFAHKLDMRDGAADGAPYLDTNAQIKVWSRVMSAEYQALVERTQAGHRDVLNPYGATNAAEFFAVVTESFFESARELLGGHPELYAVLKDFYKQDPAGLRVG